MQGVLQLVVGPVGEPVTTAEAKSHARIDINQDDALVESYIKAARAQAEEYCRRAFLTQTWRLFLDRFPDSGMILVPKAPLATVTHVKYTDADGVLQTLDAAAYQVDAVSEPARIVPAYGEVWPPTREQLNAVEIQFVAGYGADAAAVPEAAKTAIKHTVAYWYNFRESSIAGTITSRMPNTAEMVLDAADLRLFRFD